MPTRCPGPPHQGHASSDWTCPIENRNTATDRAIMIHEELLALYRKVENKERELQVALRHPDIDLPAYFKATRGTKE